MGRFHQLGHGGLLMQLLTIPEAAEALGVSKDTVYRLIDAGQLPSVQVGVPNAVGKTRPKTRVRLDQLEKFVEARTSNAVAS